MAEGGLLLQRWLWWWGLCWAYLEAAKVAPAAAAAAAATAAAGQGQCEVLDPNIQSTFSLPTNLTVKPTAPEWVLDVALGEGKVPPAACVRLDHKPSNIKLLLYEGDCKDGKLVDYIFLNHVSMTPHTWTTFTLDVKNNSVMVTGLGNDPLQLKSDRLSLPRHALHVIVAQDVEVAVGCRVNCPKYKYASGGTDIKKTVKKSHQDNIFFYFRPGEVFVRLEYEVICTTTLGNKLEPHIADIMLPDYLPTGVWHLVELQHRSGASEVNLDYRFLQEKKLPKGCTFTEHTVRVVGDSLFSFSCNPSTGQVEWEEGGSWGCSVSTQASVTNPWAAVGLTFVAEIFLGVVVYLVVVIVRNIRRRNAENDTKKTDTNTENNNKNDTNKDDKKKDDPNV